MGKRPAESGGMAGGKSLRGNFTLADPGSLLMQSKPVRPAIGEKSILRPRLLSAPAGCGKTTLCGRRENKDGSGLDNQRIAVGIQLF